MTDDPEIILTAKEYETVTDSYREELAQGRHGKDLLKSPTDGLEKCPHTLGAHFIGNTLQAYWFVGQVRLTDRIILKVKPKIDGLDFGRMYLRCLADPIVNAHLNDCFWFFWDQPDIPQLKGQTLTLLIISAYLKKFGELCRRHLRRHFIRVEENLTRKVRGKPLIQQQIRTNMVRHRMDRVYCQYQINSLDSRENQILKAALTSRSSISTITLGVFRPPTSGTKRPWPGPPWRACVCGVFFPRTLPVCVTPA
jgi:hypothetical protein